MPEIYWFTLFRRIRDLAIQCAVFRCFPTRAHLRPAKLFTRNLRMLYWCRFSSQCVVSANGGGHLYKNSPIRFMIFRFWVEKKGSYWWVFRIWASTTRTAGSIYGGDILSSLKLDGMDLDQIAVASLQSLSQDSLGMIPLQTGLKFSAGSLGIWGYCKPKLKYT